MNNDFYKLIETLRNEVTPKGINILNAIEFTLNAEYVAKGEHIVERELSRVELIASDIAKLVNDKNADYDNAFGKQLAKRGDIAYICAIENKMSRFEALTLKHKEPKIGESV
ncbi:MAG: hypothetical protein RR255_05485, partial [Bacilli bacterium]